jgi:acetylornithine deacetylase/succinyl-diaminopimelate desuccinylase-like protein
MVYAAALAFAREAWSPGGAALEGLSDVVRIPNLTSDYDPTFLTNGLVHQAMHCARDWILSQSLVGASVQLFEAPNTFPVLLLDVPGDRSPTTTTVYGHIDKMPHLDPSKWSPGLGPAIPTIRHGRLYGRGTADDCYVWYLAVTSLRFLQLHHIPHPRLLLLIESCEESGEDIFRDFLRDLSPRLPALDRVFILDGFPLDYGAAWFCTSLRGIVTADLSVRHLAAPCDSGRATGLVPSTFRVVRALLDRVEDARTGAVRIPGACVASPAAAARNARSVVARAGGLPLPPMLPGAATLGGTPEELLLSNWWRAGLAVTGADGLPPIAAAGHVMRERTALKLSLRIPPTADRFECGRQLKEALEADPPYGAKVVCRIESCEGGWAARELSPATAAGIELAAMAVFGQKPLFFGAGFSVPIAGAFQEFWPEAEVIITGVCGSESHAHGYDENIDLAYFIKWTAMFAGILAGT